MVTGSQIASELRPAEAAGPIALDDPSLYINRETSWLEFNDRVLEEALDERNPLLERLKFIAIYGTNLDEFFMIRIAGLMQQLAAEVHKRSDDGHTPEEQLELVSRHLRRSLARMTDCLHAPAVPVAGTPRHPHPAARPARHADDTDAAALFRRPRLPGAHAAGDRQGSSVSRTSRTCRSRSRSSSRRRRPKAPSTISRASRSRVRCRGSCRSTQRRRGQRWFVMLEDVIAHNLEALFPGLRVTASYLFRVTRDADLDLQEDEADDLLRAIESELRKRRFGEPVRLEVEPAMPDDLRRKLLEALELDMSDCYEVDGMLGTESLWTLVNLDEPDLHDPPFTPSIPKRLIGQTDMFAAIREGDLLLHHPYESFDPVVQFVQQAAERSQRAGDQADAVPHLRQLTGRRRAGRRRRERQASRRADRAQGALRRREQHPLGAHARARRRARRLRLGRAQDAREGDAGRARRARRHPPLHALRHRQLQRPDGAHLHRPFAVHVPRRSGRRRDAALQRADRLLESRQLRAADGRAVRTAQRVRRADRSRDRACRGRPAQPHRGQAQRRSATPVSCRRSIARRAPASRSTSSCAECACCAPGSRRERDDPRAQHRRPFPRALPHVRVRQRRPARSLHRQRRLDGPQPRPARRDGACRCSIRCWASSSAPTSSTWCSPTT